MIATRPPQVRLVLFERLARDLNNTDTLLGRALCTVDGEPVLPVLVYREADRRLAVAVPVCCTGHAVRFDAQLVIARKVKRHVRRLVREERSDG